MEELGEEVGQAKEDGEDEEAEDQDDGDAAPFFAGGDAGGVLGEDGFDGNGWFAAGRFLGWGAGEELGGGGYHRRGNGSGGLGDLGVEPGEVLGDDGALAVEFGQAGVVGVGGHRREG